MEEGKRTLLSSWPSSKAAQQRIGAKGCRVPSCQPRINNHNRFLKVTFISTEEENKNVKKTIVTKVL